MMNNESNYDREPMSIGEMRLAEISAALGALFDATGYEPTTHEVVEPEFITQPVNENIPRTIPVVKEEVTTEPVEVVKTKESMEISALRRANDLARPISDWQEGLSDAA